MSTLTPRTAARRFSRLAAGLVALATGFGTITAAEAASVHLSQGQRAGQGHAFMLGDQCYAFTAGHVLSARGEPVVLVDRDGYRAEGRVVATDPALDLGLVRIDGEARVLRQLCGGTTPRTDHRLGARLPQWAAQRHDAWLDKIESPAGGLARIELSLPNANASPDDADLLLARGESADAVLPQQGDSGAAVWLSERPGSTMRTRYDRSGAPTPRVPGILLGVLISVDGDKPRIVRADRVHRFIFDTLSPVRWDAVRIDPAGVRVSEKRRGDLPNARQATPAGPDPLDFSPRELTQVSYELDLGDIDTIVEGVTVSFMPQRDPRGRPVTHRIGVASSQYRPGAQAAWRNESCKPPADRRQADPAIVSCALRVTRIARGLRIEITGAPQALRRIAVDVAPASR